MKANPVEDAERPRLSKAAVVERGLAIADAEGMEAVTIRRLAADLGVTPMALYWHFRSKEELLVGLADRLWTEFDVGVNAAAEWSDQLRGLMESLVRVLRSHPAASSLLVQVTEQRRLAHARLAAHHQRPAFTRPDGRDQVGQHAHLAAAPPQRRGPSSRGESGAPWRGRIRSHRPSTGTTPWPGRWPRETAPWRRPEEGSMPRSTSQTLPVTPPSKLGKSAR